MGNPIAALERHKKRDARLSSVYALFLILYRLDIKMMNNLHTFGGTPCNDYVDRNEHL